MKTKNDQPKNRIHIFIDAANVMSSCISVGHLLDYSKLQKFIEEKFNGNAKRIFYYTAFPENSTRDYDTDSKHHFFTFLKKELSFYVRKKPLKTIQHRNKDGDLLFDDDGKPMTFEKGNLDVEFAMDVLNTLDHYDIAVFFTGDSDFLPLVNFIRHKKKKVFVFSSKNTISHELKCGTNGYFDLADFTELYRSKIKFRGN